MRFGKEALKNWLESKDLNEAVGYAGSGSHCPLATFYKEAIGVEYAAVGLDHMELKSNGRVRYRLTPRWAYRFIRRVDSYRSGTIKAGVALHLLKGL